MNRELYKSGGTKKSMSKHLSKFLDRASTTKDDHVYTGLKVDPSKGFKKEGEKTSTVFHHPAFISSSTSFHSTKSFRRKVSTSTQHKALNSDAPTPAEREKEAAHVLKIHVPKGSKATSVKPYSSYKHEQEVLLHHNHLIEVHHRPTIMDDGTHVWHGRIVGRKE
jgi:hypothetical protein